MKGAGKMRYRIWVEKRDEKVDMYDCRWEAIGKKTKIKDLFCTKKDIIQIIRDYNPEIYLNSEIDCFFLKEIVMNKKFKLIKQIGDFSLYKKEK